MTAYVMCVLHFDWNRAHASTLLISDEMILTQMHLNDCFERTLAGWNIQKCKCDASIMKIMIIAHYPTWKPVMHVCQLAL